MDSQNQIVTSKELIESPSKRKNAKYHTSLIGSNSQNTNNSGFNKKFDSYTYSKLLIILDKTLSSGKQIGKNQSGKSIGEYSTAEEFKSSNGMINSMIQLNSKSNIEDLSIGSIPL